MSKLYDHPQISQTYFFPQPSGPLPKTADAQPVPLGLSDGTRIGGYWSRPLPKVPTILYLHGNGECIEHQLEHWPQWAREAGANIFFVDYPGYATSDGDANLTGCCLAATAAYDYLCDQSVNDVPGVIVAGRSVGTIFALDCAARAAAATSTRLWGLMLESGIADVRQRLAIRVPYEQWGLDRAGVERQLARDFDHQAKLRQLTCPVLILHTRDDGLVPCTNSEQLADWAGSALLRLVLFDVGDHNSIQLFNAREYRQQLREFVVAARAAQH